MNKIEVKSGNQLNIDKASAQHYVKDMVYQLYEIAELAGLEQEANLLYAASLALSPTIRKPRG